MASRAVSIAALALVLACSASLWLRAAQAPARERASSTRSKVVKFQIRPNPLAK